MSNPETLEGVVLELLGIFDQAIPEFGSPRSAEASFSRGRNAEKTAAANYLRYHLVRLGIIVSAPPIQQDVEPWSRPRLAASIVQKRAVPESYDECRDTAFLGHLYDRHLPTSPPTGPGPLETEKP